ncbi:MAG: tetratricopeptide repeat protein [Tepidisphaeraceae bacterium]
MSESNVREQLLAALRHHQSGRLREAEELYRRILAQQPDHAETLALLGVVLSQSGRHEEALVAIERAVQLSPGNASHHYNHGVILVSAGRPDEAIAAYDRALAIEPTSAEAYCNLGNIQLGKKRFDEAAAAFQRSLAIRPRFADAQSGLGNALFSLGKPDEATAAYFKALEIEPNNSKALTNLGLDFFRKGKWSEAISVFRRAAALDPNLARTHFNLGTALGRTWQYDEAADCFQRAVALQPNYTEAHVNLGNALRDSGQLDEALACYRRALEIEPGNAIVHSNIAYTAHFHPAYDAAAIFAQLSQWDHRHAQPLRRTLPPHQNDRRPARRLKIGYLSCEFWAQAEAHFVLPLLEAHDRQAFEIHCFSTGTILDQTTQRHRQAADVWHDVATLSDIELAEKIRADQIDILIDLNMHMRDNRLLVFARKPAPIQVAWLAYPGGTGLRTMDYRFTDRFMDPPDQPGGVYSEESISLGDCWCSYDPLIEIPFAARRAPGPIRFASLNNPCKLNEAVLRLWAAVLRGMPDSRLLLLSNSPRQQKRIHAIFEEQGVAASRVEFAGAVPRPQYMTMYNRIDIALDPLPYNGITTTCDAMWMGVPVVSLTGATACGRAGLSLMSAVGLPDMVARRDEDFAPLAIDLARDSTRLAGLRRSLRKTMSESILMNGKLFAGKVESAYRAMWQRWCSGV